MKNRMTKVAALALVTLTAAAPFAMASTAPVADVTAGTPVVVAPLAPQPDMPRLTAANDLQGLSSNVVRVAEYNSDPKMPDLARYAGSSLAGTAVVTSGQSATSFIGR